MKWWRRLDARLFASYVAVAVAGAVALLVTTRLLVPPLFDRRMGGVMGRGAARGASMHDAVVAALDRALLVALLVSLVAGALVAVAVARRILRPIERVRTAARRMAAGHYDERISPPAESELAALAADVNALARALAETEQRRAELISDVAHELRTPLTSIRGYAEGMLDAVIAPDAEVLGAVLGEVARLQRLAADLSALSRADEGALALRPARLDLAALAGRVADSLRPQAAAAGIELHAGGDPVEVAGDEDRLTQVVTNLLANALTYTPRGGQVNVTVSTEGGAAVLRVTDTGIGLSGADLERVFDRFYRVQGVERPPGGSGIGLAIARAIVRAHHGDLGATSPGPGRGATFTARLPIAAGVTSRPPRE